MYSDESPINPIPPVVAVLALAIIGIEAAFQLGERGLIGGHEAVGWRLAAMSRYAFVGEVFDQMWARNLWPAEHLLRFVSYPFVHASFTHAAMVTVFVLALGKMVGEIFGWLAVLVVFFGASAFGALVYGAALDDPYPLVGGFTGAYGLIGAFTFLLWVRLAASGGPQHRAFALIAVLMGIQLVFGLIFGGGKDWVSEIAGFAAGFGLSFVVAPGALARMISRFRQR